GVIGDLLGWRGVFAILGLFGSIVTIAAFFAFRGVVTPAPAPFNRAAVMANFRSIFADPRAKVCFISVFFEAVFIHGLFPYVALLLLAIGETRAAIAGLLIAPHLGSAACSIRCRCLSSSRACASDISWWQAGPSPRRASS